MPKEEFSLGKAFLPSSGVTYQVLESIVGFACVAQPGCRKKSCITNRERVSPPSWYSNVALNILCSTDHKFEALIKVYGILLQQDENMEYLLVVFVFVGFILQSNGQKLETLGNRLKGSFSFASVRVCSPG